MNYRYAVIGAGAVGGFYGIRLAQSGAEVSFLLKSDYEHVLNNGLRLESVEGDIQLNDVEAYSDPVEMERCDVAIVGLKSVNNPVLPGILNEVLNDYGIVILLQNGYREEEEIYRIERVRKLYSGLCFICSTKTGPGLIKHTDYGLVNLAEYGPGYEPLPPDSTAHRIQEDFNEAGLKISLKDNLHSARWEKLVWNIPFNGLSVALNADTRELLDNPYSLDIVYALMHETLRGAELNGAPVDKGFPEKMIRTTRSMKPYYPSMKADYDRGRRLETESIFGNPLRSVKDKGENLQCIEMLYRELSFLNPA